jgi:hypothetical protein
VSPSLALVTETYLRIAVCISALTPSGQVIELTSSHGINRVLLYLEIKISETSVTAVECDDRDRASFPNISFYISCALSDTCVFIYSDIPQFFTLLFCRFQFFVRIGMR